MASIRIIGAGSIGNHLAHASRKRNWDVMLTDIDPVALNRAQDEIYPTRYGSWDPEIRLADSRDTMGDECDVVFIGTPPDTHLELALETLEKVSPGALIIEKPLCGPDLSDCAELWEQVARSDTFVGVGYNHTLGQNTKAMEEFIAKNSYRSVQTVSAKTREHWGGIFNAHPWLAGPENSYLGFSSRGGGACGEHSHAINIWQHFSRSLGAGRVEEVNACLDMRCEGTALYDQLAILSLRTEQGLYGEVIQDVVTFPTEKMSRIQWEDAFAEWHVGYRPGRDAIITGDSANGGAPVVEEFIKSRAEDFILEVQHLEDILEGKVTDSPIRLERGLDTMMVIAAAFQSAYEKRTVSIDWKLGYTSKALQ